MSPVAVDVVMRCRNEMPHTRRALEALRAQRGVSIRIVFFDCASSDGSREEAVGAGAEVIDLEPARYVPGRVLNAGMARTATPFVAFVNADAVACDEDALRSLVEPLRNQADVAATFARQLML